MDDSASRDSFSSNTSNGQSEKLETDEIIKWTESLPIVHINQWGGMVSTPDNFLKELLWKTLNEVQCPASIINEMIKNCTEKNWPAGLNNLETRQLSRHQYKNYVCREILYNKAIVIMYYENRHMPLNMISHPGIVMAFAYGIVND